LRVCQSCQLHQVCLKSFLVPAVAGAGAQREGVAAAPNKTPDRPCATHGRGAQPLTVHTRLICLCFGSR
jgi:hypothetical protein